MDFGMDETQLAIGELAAEVLSKEAETEQSGPYDERAWAAMAKVGLLSLAVPPELGGDGLGIGEIAVVLTDVGKRAARVPALATIGLGVLPVARFGTPSQRASLLPDVASGRALLTAALSEPGAALTATPATKVSADGLLTGVKAGVPYAEQAAHVLVPASLPDGVGVFLLDPRSPGVSLRRTPSASGSPEYTISLDGAAGELLGDDVSGAAAAALVDFAIAGSVALGSGALAGALELTTVHLRTRHQFGKPLATFQAVAQQVADVYIAARTVELAATSAIWRLATGRDARSELDLAAYWLTVEALPALRTCHHLHGGLGVDVTYPLHRYYSTLKDLARCLGGAGHRLEVLGS